MKAVKREYSVTPWTAEASPSESEVRVLLAEQGLSGYRWSNRPGDIYGAHTHPFHKIIYVLQGSITFILPDKEESITLRIGDRLDLPADLEHKAEVGQQGVICFEAHETI